MTAPAAPRRRQWPALPNSGRFVDAAVRYAIEGWPIFPLKPRQKTPMSLHGVKDATTDRQTILNWWRKFRPANIGLATGHGLIVIDIDGPDGRQTAIRLHRERGPWPATLMARSGRLDGGVHLYYRIPADLQVRNTAGDHGRAGLGPNIDVRGRGGYVVLAPSIHPSGRRFAWINPRQRPADLPGWLVEHFRDAYTPIPRPAAPDPDQIGDRDRAYAAGALRREAAQLAATGQGGRNHRLNTAAFVMGGFVAAGLIDEDVVRHTLLAAAAEAGLRQWEATRTIDSGISAGHNHPRGAPPPGDRT